MQVTIPQTTVTVPGPATLLRSWRWTLLAALVLAFTLAGGARPAAAVESINVPDAAGNVGYYTSLELDASGNPVVSYRDADSNLLGVLHCNDANCAPGGDSATGPNNGGLYSSLELDAAGNPVVSHTVFNGVDYDLVILHCNDANCAGGGESTTFPDSSSVDLHYTSLELDAAGFPVVSYYDNTNFDLKVLHCNDANCAGGDESITSPDTAGSVGSYTSLALDATGKPVVAYYDTTNGDLKVLHCNDANCTGGITTSPDTGAGGGDVGRYTSLALDGSGRPVISYWDATNNDLKVMHCNDVNCENGGESITSHGAGVTLGEYSSLALDANGYPVISYFYSWSGWLQLMHCDDANCAPGGSESVVNLDGPATPGFGMGHWTSLALDKAGQPVVSYQAYTDLDLRVAHCNDPDCSSTEKQLPINITNVGQYALPKSCFEVRNASQVPYFEVCDNDVAGAPESDPICLPDGVCNDDDPALGSVRIPVQPGDYRVVESQAAPQHAADVGKQVCTNTAPVGGDKCELTFTNTPRTRPWHPWDITGPVGGLPDGKVRVDDILAVVTHYFQDKALP